jgi:hypothetical protein
MAKPANKQPEVDVENVIDALEEEQHAIELPAREAFSVVFSSPTFLHADDAIADVVEEIAPAEPEIEPPPA